MYAAPRIADHLHMSAADFWVFATSDHGVLDVSDSHLVLRAIDAPSSLLSPLGGEYVHAGRVTPGDALWVVDEDGILVTSTVHSIITVEMEGMCKFLPPHQWGWLRAVAWTLRHFHLANCRCTGHAFGHCCGKRRSEQFVCKLLQS